MGEEGGRGGFRSSIDNLVRLFYSLRTTVLGEATMESVVVAIAVVISSAYLLWQLWEAEFIDQL
jgi:hypothetical protein